MDNAATSWPKPQSVLREIEQCLSDYCANPGRGSHKLSELSTQTVNKCRMGVADLINATNYNRVVFTKNCTEATNHLLYGFLGYGDHVLVSPMEHNAVMRPLWHMQRNRNIKLNFLDLQRLLHEPQKELRRKLTSKTKLIICMLSSNVTGLIFPIEEIGALANEKGIPFFVDAAQGLGSVEVDVDRFGISMLAFPGHKNLYGPQGTGGFWVSDGIELNPLLRGGTGFNSANQMQGREFPSEYESGTLNVPGIAGLTRGIEFINNYGRDNIRKNKNEMTEYMTKGFSEINGVQILSERNISNNSGIVSININGYNSRDAAKLLDFEYDIAVRGGLHCAPQAHVQLGTNMQGCVRFSPSVFNAMCDIDECIRAVSQIAARTSRERVIF